MPQVPRHPARRQRAADLRKSKPAEPTLDDYFTSASALARLVRAAFVDRDSVKRSALLEALETFERIDRTARAYARQTRGGR